MSDDPKRIFLECGCAFKNDEGRQWCEDDVWVRCEECGGLSVEYIRADLIKDFISKIQGAVKMGLDDE